MSDEQTTEIVPDGGGLDGGPHPEGALDEDEWPTRGPARGIRLAVPAAALLAALLVGAGFWGGATLQKDRGSGSSSGGGGGGAALVSRLRALAGATGARGATGASGTTGASGVGGLFGGGAASGTAGTISVVDGDILYVLTTSGALVKVTLDPSTTTITRNAATKAADLRPGDTVVVQGTTSADGDVSATSVAATAPGVTSSRFGGGFFNGGSGTGTGSASSGATG